MNQTQRVSFDYNASKGVGEQMKDRGFNSNLAEIVGIKFSPYLKKITVFWRMK